MQNTATGQPWSWPPIPSSTGTGPTPVRRTKPASTNAMIVRNSPMPTEIAILSGAGTAWKTASRNPVSTRIRMISPSITTRPIASAQVIWLAIENVTNAFSPSPVARASGKLATTPIRMVITPATNAVAAATAAKSPSASRSPFMSVPLSRMIGLSTMM